MATSPFMLRRLLALSRKRIFADIISWFVFLLITIGFCTVYLWFQFETGRAGTEYNTFLEFVSKKSYEEYEVIRFIEAFRVILINSIIYTVIMMLPVYLNLEVFKKYILDQKATLRFWNYFFYLFAAALSAFIFAGILFLILKYNPRLLKVKIGLPLNMLAIFGIQLISTGMVYRREVLKKERAWARKDREVQKSREKLEDLQEKLEKIEVSANKSHIKVGSKNNFQIIDLHAILYLQGDGNEPLIFTNDEKGKYYGTSRLVDYEKILPPDQFIRIHKSYIISKSKVTARKGKCFLLQGTEEEIPIGKTYEEKVSGDEYLGFNI